MSRVWHRREVIRRGKRTRCLGDQYFSPLCDLPLRSTLMEFKERRYAMTSLFMLSSALEVGFVIAASAIFVAMVITVLALITWFVAGIVSASHP